MPNKIPKDISGIVDNFIKEVTEAVKSKKMNAKTKQKNSKN